MADQSPPTFWIEDKGDHLVVINDNPAQKNPLSLGYHALQIEALNRAAAEDRITSVIFTGRGGYFSAGGDLAGLKDALDGSDAEKAALIGALQDVIAAMRACPKPLIAAVNGGAAGAGLSIALACDFVIADASATFLAAHVKIGATIDGGLTWFLARQLPHALASEICILGGVVTAETLGQHGVINSVVAKGTAEEAAQDLAAKLSRGPSTTQSKLKQLLVAAQGHSLDAQLEAERAALVDTLNGPAAREGITAFLDKRRPDFAAVEERNG